MALMPKGQREQMLVFIALLSVLAAGAYWNWVYAPRAAELTQLEERVENLIVLNRKAKSELAKGSVEDLRRQLTMYREGLELVRSLVPTGSEVPALLEQVSTAARRVGLDLASVNPEPVERGADYDTYRFNMELLGSYHELAVFLTNVGSLTRIVLPANLTLSAPSNPSAAAERQKEKTAVIEARFQIETYVARNSAGRESADGRPTRVGAE